MSKVIRIIENVLFMIAMFIMVCALICQIAGLKPVVVMSGSMEPAIPTGSLAFIGTGDQEIAAGDVITFNAGGLLVTHRVIGITERGYKTKGDNNVDPDAGFVKAASVEGKMMFRIPVLGRFLKSILLPAGISVTLLYILLKVIYRGKRL